VARDILSFAEVRHYYHSHSVVAADKGRGEPWFRGGEMKQKRNIIVSLLMVFSAIPASAQVEKVAMRTTGISCGLCAGLSELSFRRVPGVDKVAISLSKEAIMLSYKPGATFDPAGIRKILEPLKVGVVEFQISARGRVEAKDGKKFFRAGKDMFALAAIPNAPTIPSNTPVIIEGILDDRSKPMEVKVLNFKPL
jgi:hypothetical protein